ncbi:hypothetical protein [Caulobacter sp. S45]|uniref:hypothetical protein n=1 Tax=Caulobacter sp. S45 TaxID=1641861 RepID=UPI001575303D|nr:hypothetical protein [Caulobacter sp. S45]
MHLVIGTPCYGGLVSQRYMQSVCALLLDGSRSGVTVTVEMIGYDSLVTRARNSLVAKFLDTPSATHLLFVDADIGFTAEAVVRMLAFDQEVVAGMYPLKVVHYDAAVFERMQAGESLESAQTRYVGTLEGPDERQTIDGFSTGVFAGCGFMLISRGAFDKLIAAYPDTRYVASHNRMAPSLSPNQFALFDCLIDPETREYLSEDYAFCQRWRAIGGRIWLDTRSRLGHIGPREFVGDAAQRFGRT